MPSLENILIYSIVCIALLALYWYHHKTSMRKSGFAPNVQPASDMKPMILSGGGKRVPLIQNPLAIETSESDMNIALRSIIHVMVKDGLLSRADADEFIKTHGVIIAYRKRGLSGLLRKLGVDEDSIKGNHTRIIVIKIAGE